MIVELYKIANYETSLICEVMLGQLGSDGQVSNKIGLGGKGGVNRKFQVVFESPAIPLSFAMSLCQVVMTSGLSCLAAMYYYCFSWLVLEMSKVLIIGSH